MLFTPLLIGATSIAARVSANTETNQRNDDIQAPSSKKPVGIRKMSSDSGEKFFMHYWHFEQDDIAANSTEAQQDSTSSHTEVERSSIILPREYYYQPPLFERSALLLAPRDFQCPAGTKACTSIDRSDICCGTDETCVQVEDTGSGDVGCCPAGQDCSGTIGSCWEGYTTCPSSVGGGCCFPGYDCVEGGCSHVVTVTLTFSSTTLTTTSTETIPATSTTTSTTESTTSSSTSTGDLSPPNRPTSSTTSTSSSSETETACPTGFYACAAVYHGGCCQTGRDCDTTSCPAVPSTTIVSDGRTIVAAEPTKTADSSEEGGPKVCASGWFSCADTVDGGCCPTGYACGSSSCTAVPTASKTGTVDKVAPTVESMAGAVKMNWAIWWTGLIIFTISTMLW